MNIIRKIKRVKERPERLIIGIQLRIAHLFNNQTLLIKALYRLGMGKRLDLKNPKTFSEKLQWLKLHDHNELYHSLVDKHAVKQYVSDRIGKEYVIPSYGIWDCFDDIDFDSLPEQFVLKTTNGGGGSGVVICHDKSTFSKESAKVLLEKSMKNDIYRKSGEWAYKNVRPRILAEEYIEQDPLQNLDDYIKVDKSGFVSAKEIHKGKGLNDYKFFCFNGKVKALFVATNRFDEKGSQKNVKFDFYDESFNHLPFCQGHPNADVAPVKPKHFDEMIVLAEKLSIGIPHVRVDLYESGDKVFFGEMTFYHFGGFVPFNPDSWDEVFGQWIDLNRVNE